jgi:hypothetical protein
VHILPDKRSDLIRDETAVYKTLNTKKKTHNSHESKLVGTKLSHPSLKVTVKGVRW